ncbi:MAG: 60S ribosomal export protein NMD3 [Methanotrichaceae archaeon]|nr:60S ribosomal export protein NMD3 [Methanotrichaceae archaeon]
MRPDDSNVRRSICPRCGLPSAEGLCPKCLLASTTLLSCPRMVELVICATCGCQLVQGRWQIVEIPLEELIFRAVRGSVGVHVDLMDAQIDVSISQRGSTRYLAKVSVEGRILGLEAKEECEIEVRLRREACDRCSKMAGKYFEAVVQLRGSGRSPTQEEISTAENAAHQLAQSEYRRGDRLAFIQEIKPTRGGVDMVVGSAQLGRQIASLLHETLGGNLRESSKLVGMKDGRDIYRITILVRLPRLRQGDIISIRGRLMEMKGYDRNRAILEDLLDGGRHYIPAEEADVKRVLSVRQSAKRSVIVAADESAVEILDPESFQAVIAPRPKHIHIKPGDEVDVIRIGDGFVLLG